MLRSDHRIWQLSYPLTNEPDSEKRIPVGRLHVRDDNSTTLRLPHWSPDRDLYRITGKIPTRRLLERSNGVPFSRLNLPFGSNTMKRGCPKASPSLTISL